MFSYYLYNYTMFLLYFCIFMHLLCLSFLFSIVSHFAWNICVIFGEDLISKFLEYIFFPTFSYICWFLYKYTFYKILLCFTQTYQDTFLLHTFYLNILYLVFFSFFRFSLVDTPYSHSLKTLFISFWLSYPNISKI